MHIPCAAAGVLAKKIENLFHCVFIFVFLQFLLVKSYGGLHIPCAAAGVLAKNRKLVSLRFHFCFPANPFESKLSRICRKTKIAKQLLRYFFAERGGFEPPVPVTQYVSLANWWFQPLTHLSVAKLLASLTKGKTRVQRYTYFT